MNTEEWEAALIVEIACLKASYSTGINFFYQVRQQMSPSDEQLQAMEIMLITLKNKFERLESELLMHRILKGES